MRTIVVFATFAFGALFAEQSQAAAVAGAWALDTEFRPFAAMLTRFDFTLNA